MVCDPTKTCLQPFRPSMPSSSSALYRLYHSIDCFGLSVHSSSSVEHVELTKARMLRCFELLMLLPQLLVSLHNLTVQSPSFYRCFWSQAKLSLLATISHGSTLLMLQVCWFECREKNNVSSSLRKKDQLKDQCLQCLLRFGLLVGRLPIPSSPGTFQSQKTAGQAVRP